jgi:hypothetical protein
MYTRRLLPKLILGVAFLLLTTAAAAVPAPSGSVAFETAEGSSPGDTLWTGCTVLFKGKLSPCTVSGLSAPRTGLARVSGMVYGLKNVEDVAGTYKAVGDDFALGEGHLTVENQHGVRMVLTAFGQLTELQAANKGIEVKLTGAKQ